MVTKATLSKGVCTGPDQSLSLSIVIDQKYPAKLHARKVAHRLLNPPKTSPPPCSCLTSCSVCAANAISSISAPRPTPRIIYLPGQPILYPEYSDQPIKFRQRRYFMYLTGCNQPNCHLTYDVTTDKLTLYIPPLDPREVVWTGMPPSIEDSLREYDVDDVRYTTELRNDLDEWVAGPGRGGIVHCLDELSTPPVPEGEVGWGWAGLCAVEVECSMLRPAVDDCRVYKDTYELGLMRRALDATRRGHEAVLAFLRNTHGPKPKLSIESLTEADVEAEFLRACIAVQAKTQAYDPIAAAGKNGATLHYTKNNAPLAGKQLLLLDAGAEWQCYASDITRTFPINGLWTPEAKRVYDIVDRMQRECIMQTVDGVPWRETHMLAARIAVEGLLELGIFRNGSVEEILKQGTYKAFYPHGIGHMIGLETHDVEGTRDDDSGYDPHASERRGVPRMEGLRMGPRRAVAAPHVPLPDEYSVMVDRVLRAGMVVTVEPGIYFCEWIIQAYLRAEGHAKYIDRTALNRYWDVGGVRIEDVVLVLENGNEVLSKDIPKGW
ncbi:peptidase M24, structural domain-containing protein [Kalaharituber pfeilii]|nr:peptidase M24, structural domain-containing protein [Kalaharituber pfeilii]